MLKLVIDEPSHINFIITYVKISYFFWLTDDMHDALKYMHPDLVICSFKQHPPSLKEYNRFIKNLKGKAK